MYCPKCGSFLADDAQFCPSCNEPVNHTAAGAQQNDGVYYTPQQGDSYNNSTNEQNNTYYNNAQPNYNAQSNYFNQAQPNNQGYYQANQPNYIEQQFKDIISNANTLGVLAIVLGILLTPLAGIICGAVGLSKLNSVPDLPMNPYITKDKAKAKKLNLIGIILPIALYVVAIIFMVIVFTFMGLATASALSFM